MRLSLARAIAVRFRRSDSSVSPAKAPARAKATVDNHQANIRMLRCLPQTYNFKILIFWQPSLASSNKPLKPSNENSNSDRACSSQPNSFAILKAVNYEAVRRSLQGGDFIFPGTFSNPCKNLFTFTISCTSTSVFGDQIVARAIAKSLEDHPGK